MQQFIIEIMDKFGYLGISFLIALENIFPPIPSEIVLSFGGFMTTYTSLTVPLVILFSTIGAVIGALVNGLIIGLELYLALSLPFMINAFYVFAGEFAVLIVGAIIFKLIERNESFMKQYIYE